MGNISASVRGGRKRKGVNVVEAGAGGNVVVLLNPEVDYKEEG